MAVEFSKSAFMQCSFFGTLCTRPAAKSKISARASTRTNPSVLCHPERKRRSLWSRQSSSANQPSQCSASLELFARDLQRNQRFRLGLRPVRTPRSFVILSEKGVAFGVGSRVQQISHRNARHLWNSLHETCSEIKDFG